MQLCLVGVVVAKLNLVLGVDRVRRINFFTALLAPHRWPHSDKLQQQTATCEGDTMDRQTGRETARQTNRETEIPVGED